MNNQIKNIPVLKTVFILLGFIFELCINSASAQLTVDMSAPYNSPSYLVQNVLLGNGVVASNFTYNGDPLQIGLFRGGAGNIGLDSGIVLSSDEISALDISAGGFGQTSFSSGNNPDLLSVANSVPPLIGQSFTIGDVNDVAELEFDFIPSSDTVSFAFVFGSNEYLTFVNSSYNDVFSFFISGPAITGPYTSPAAFPGGAQNIALVPGSNPPLPITISSVNDVLNNQYYIDNPFPNAGVALNGYTTKLNAVSPVVCGELHHIRISIADAEDQSLASAVFLEGGSFKSGNLFISANPTFNTNTGDSILYEGCGDVELILSRVDDVALQDTIYFELSGMAQNGIDFTSIPDSAFFLPGQDSVLINFTVLTDALIEGPETLFLKVYGDTNVCGYKPQFLSLVIHDPFPIVSQGNYFDTLSCFTPFLDLTDSVIQGITPCSFAWSTGFTETPIDSSSSIQVSPGNSSYYFVTITDACGLSVQVDTFLVYVPPANISINAPHESIVCSGDSVTLQPTILGGLPPYQIWWETSVSQGTGLDLTMDSTRAVTLFVTDACADDTASISIWVTVPVYPALVLNPLSDIQIFCPGSPIAVLASANGGSGGYVFTWDQWDTLSAQLQETPLTTTSYTVQVTDFCHTDTLSQTIQVTVPQYPPYTLAYNDSNMACYGDTVGLDFTVSGGTGVYDFVYNNQALDTNYIETVLYSNQVIEIGITDQCLNDTNITIYNYIKEPVANFEAFYYDINHVVFINHSKEDLISHFWAFGDGASSAVEGPTHSYAATGQYDVVLVVTNDVGCIDSMKQTIKSPDILWTPNAFTPDDDGLNDVWYPIHNGFKPGEYLLTIYTRWGDVIFQTNDPSKGWDGKDENGKPAELAVYHYVLEGKELFHNTEVKIRDKIVLVK